MDLMAPLIHEFTYQAMAHDLLPIKDGEKTTFHMTINDGDENSEEKDMELQEKDKVWIDNRHRHMKDTIDKLMGDFQKFLDQNPHFTNENSDTTSLNAIKDMLAGLPQFQEMKEAYSLHLTMAQECMNIFQHNKLPDIASVEQTLATGLDEDFRKPKGILDQVVRLLDDDAVTPSDRLRLVMMYILYRDGVIPEDVKKLLAHSSLPPQDGEIISNLELLGGRTTHGLKEMRAPPTPLFVKNTKGATINEEYALSRFEPAVHTMLDELCKGTLDQTTFPYVNPPTDPNEDLLAAQGGSLRAGRPNWAAAGRRQPENRQRHMVFMAGGATYSESRACYDVSARHGRDIFMITSHMLTPQLFVRQVGDLGIDKRRLDLPMERPKPKAPAHLFERERPAPTTQPPPMPSGRAPGPVPPQQGMPIGGRDPRQQRPQQMGGARPGGLPGAPKAPSAQMGQMTLSSRPVQASNGGDYESPSSAPSESKPHKLEKKRRNFLGMKKS
jgi:syntaxin-binding protein 1